MDEQEREKAEVGKYLDLTWDVATKVREFVPGSIKWTARQANADHTWKNVYGFAIDDKFASVTTDELDNITDELIRNLATKMLGYAPNSQQDMEHKLQEAYTRKLRTQSEINELNEYLEQLQSTIDEIEQDMVMNGWPVKAYSI